MIAYKKTLVFLRGHGSPSNRPKDDQATKAQPVTPRLYVALLTPLDRKIECRTDLLATHCRRLLGCGVDGLALFGTTGFGPVLSTPQRMGVLESLVEAGIAANRLIVGTSAASMADMVRLTRHAAEAGCAGCFVMPPFFFPEGQADGVADSYAHLIEATGNDRLRLYLYNIPAFHPAPIPVHLVGQLYNRFPATIAGIKDSSGNREYLHNLLGSYPQLEIYTGIEPLLPEAIDAGGAGAITGLANLVPRLLRRLCGPSSPDRRAALEQIKPLVNALPSDAILPALAQLMALLSDETAWQNLPPPLRRIRGDVMQPLAQLYREHSEWSLQAAS